MNPRIRDWTGKRIWIIGASTGIGSALGAALAMRGARVALSARGAARLEVAAAGMAGAIACPLDVCDSDAMQQACIQLEAAWGGIDLVVYAAGAYQPMRADAFDCAAANRMLDVNVRGAYHCLDAVLPVLLRQQHGALALVSSVAGYTGLPQALAYGPTKAALINLAEVLYTDLHPYGIGVHLVNPGFVDTPLTKGNDFHMPALISPAEAAGHIIDGLGKGEFHIHFPRRFTNLLRFLRLLPYPLAFRVIRKVTKL